MSQINIKYVGSDYSHKHAKLVTNAKHISLMSILLVETADSPFVYRVSTIEKGKINIWVSFM